MQPKPEKRRLRVRKAFNEPIPFEVMLREAGRIKNIQENGVCLDISESGLGGAADLTFQKGEVLKLFLPVKRVHMRLPVFAEVVWSARSNGHFRVGLRILQ